MKNWEKLVFFDLDGTLLDGESKVTAETAKAMITLREKSVLPLISSGRSPGEIEEIMKGTKIDSYVGFNGQYVVAEGVPILENALPVPLIERMAEFAKERNHPISFYGRNHYTATFHDHNLLSLYEMDHATVPEIDQEYYKKNAIFLMELFFSDQSAEAEYLAEFGGELRIMRDSPYSLAVVTKGNSKKSGVEYLIRHLKAETLPVYIFGDGNNDLDMFDLKATKVAMGNAAPALKEKADYITDTNLANGVIKGLSHFGLI